MCGTHLARHGDIRSKVSGGRSSAVAEANTRAPSPLSSRLHRPDSAHLLGFAQTFHGRNGKAYLMANV